ncbi:hypothetical protein EDD21DRAFT_133191 [Dissophora ornata]|nr:hypothetical protein EDD21DRAFT_133191 [Dissophora ornata]
MRPDGLTMSTGETNLRSTKTVLGELADEYGNEGSEAGRRVDLKFSHGIIEVANVELNSPSQKRTARVKQTRNSLRLGRYIQRQPETLGVHSPQILCGDITGYMAILYVAGKVTSHVAELPTTRTALKNFLDGSTLSCIVNFMERLAELGGKAHEAFEICEAQESETELEGDVEYEEMPRHSAPKSVEETVILTPKRKRSLKPPEP